MSNTRTRTLDSIYRIYKNTDGDALGTHCIEVVEGREETPLPGRDDTGTMDDRRKRRLTTNVTFTRMNLVMGSSRVVTTVQMLGGYDNFVLNGSSNDIIKVIYAEGETNEAPVYLDHFPTVGDTL